MTAVDVTGEVRALAAGLLGSGPADPWRALVDAGLAALAVPAALGGEGLGATEVAAVLTELGRGAVDSPALATTALGVLPVVRWGTPAQQEELLRPVAERGAVLTAALREPAPGPLPRTVATRSGEGFLVHGTVIGVPWAERAHRMLVPVTLDGEARLVIVDPAAAGVTPGPSSSGTPVATVRFDGAEVGPGALLPGGSAAVGDVHRCAAAGAAAYADGLVAGALDLTARHVGTREQFGRPLATFQAVAQRLGDVYVAARTLHLAAGAAAAALDAPDPDAGADPEVAATLAVRAAREAIASCHHLHGGTGLDRSYPLHAYSAAASDLAHLLGGPAAVVDRLAAAADRDPPAGEGPSRGLGLTPEQRDLRARLRAYFSTLLTEQERETLLVERHGPAYREIVRRMGRDGWLGLGWPEEHGGHGLGLVEQQIFVDEVTRADVPWPSVTLQTVGPVLQEHGTAEQKAFFLPRILSGELHFAIGYSEPGAGTDLAALSTRAVRDGDGWVVDGQKLWTTGGHEADFVWLAVRTDPDAPRHRGISILVVDTSDPGYSWTPIITSDGAHHVNATYYAGVRVPAGRLVGEENRGWRLITEQLNHERVMLGPAGRIDAMYSRVLAWAREHGLTELTDVRRALAEVLADLRVNQLLNLQVASRAGAVDVADASTTKVFGAAATQRAARSLADLLAAHGDPAEPGTAALIRWFDVQAKRHTVLTFGGGVDEIQRELIVTIGLGLPRVPR